MPECLELVLPLKQEPCKLVPLGKCLHLVPSEYFLISSQQPCGEVPPLGADLHMLLLASLVQTEVTSLEAEVKNPPPSDDAEALALVLFL